MSRFGFTVKRRRDYADDGAFEQAVVVPGEWCVFLPHQCDAWDIAGETGTAGSSIDGESHEDAVAALEAFLAEGQAALEALKAEREFDGEEAVGNG